MTSHWEASVPMLSVVTMLSSAPKVRSRKNQYQCLRPSSSI